MDTVCVYNGERQWTIRACVLASASPVLHAILEGSSAVDRRIHMEHRSGSIDLFLGVAHAVSYDYRTCTDAFDEEIAITDVGIVRLIDDDVLRMIHKYETHGILQHLCSLLCKSPDADIAIRICAMFPENTQWCDAGVCACVARHLDGMSFESIEQLPPALLARLWVWHRRTTQVFRAATLSESRSLTLAR